MSAQLQFSVSNQIITRHDNFDVVADSIDYLYAQFTFNTEEWNDKTITAQFRSDQTTQSYEYILNEDNTCLVPHEVLESTNGGYFYVSVFAGTLITTNIAKVFVQKSGYDGNAGSSEPPTPSVYQQLLDELNEVKEKLANIDGGLFTDWQQEGD